MYSTAGQAPFVIHAREKLGSYDWVSGDAYVIGDQITSADGTGVFEATADHTGGSTTEPGVGVDWATVWDLISTTGTNGGFYAEGRRQWLFEKSDGTAVPGTDQTFNTVTDPISGASVTLHTRYSPAANAAYVIRTAGTYRVRMRYQNRKHVWTDYVTSATITVASNTRTKRYVNGSTGSDAYDGTSATVDGGGVGPKLTLNGALALVNSDNWDIEIADDTTCDCTAYTNLGSYAGIWIHGSGGGTNKPVVVMKQAYGNSAVDIGDNSIVERIEWEYFSAVDASDGRRIGVGYGQYRTNVAVIDCDFNEVVEVVGAGSDRYPTAILYMRLLAKEEAMRYSCFMEGFHGLNFIACIFDKGSQGEHIIRLKSLNEQGGPDTKPYDVSKYVGVEYCTLEMADTMFSSGKSTLTLHVRHGAAYRTTLTDGSCGAGGDVSVEEEGFHLKNNVYDNCVISFSNTGSPQGFGPSGWGQFVIRASVILVDGDISDPTISCGIYGSVRFLNCTLISTNPNANNANFYNIHGPTDDIIVRGNIFSYDPTPWASSGQPRFYPGATVAEVEAGMVWEDNIHQDMSAANPTKEFMFFHEGSLTIISLADAELQGWASGNVEEDHTFDADYQPITGGTDWETVVGSYDGVFASINGVEWTDAGPAGAWRAP